jgi:hypothetical protein
LHRLHNPDPRLSNIGHRNVYGLGTGARAIWIVLVRISIVFGWIWLVDAKVGGAESVKTTSKGREVKRDKESRSADHVRAVLINPRGNTTRAVCSIELDLKNILEAGTFSLRTNLRLR